MKRIFSCLLICFVLLITISAYADESDFVIDENGVLTGYTGSDVNIEIPYGVTSFGTVFVGNEKSSPCK